MIPALRGRVRARAGTTDDALTLLIDGVEVPLRIMRPARARSYRLSIGARGELRLSVPPRASLKRALGWAQQHEGWVRTQMAKRPDTVLLCDGARVPVEGRNLHIRWLAGAARTVRIEGDGLLLGGPADGVAPRVVRWLKARARTVLEEETRAMAADHGLTVASVGIGDPRSRWGSCTSDGAIRYSWRLILCPPDVRRATVAHELAHLLHMDHSRAFHDAHARILDADPAPARAWLRLNGSGLHRYIG